MRRWLVLVMVLLLPLRGWAGDLMGVQMAASSSAHATAAMPPDCPMHAAQPAAQGAPDMQSCASCDLCIPMAEFAARQRAAVGIATHEKPPMPLVSFVSASLPRAVEPPIS